jgi:hypothetical protein
MQGCHQGQAHVLDFQHAVTEALVIVYQVVIVAVLAQVFHRPAPKGVGFGKTPGQFAHPLNNIGQGLHMPRSQGQQAILEQVQAGQLNQAYPGVQVGIGRTGNYVYRVARIHQSFAQIPEVDPLAAAIWLAAVAQQGNAQGLARCDSLDGAACWAGKWL